MFLEMLKLYVQNAWWVVRIMTHFDIPILKQILSSALPNFVMDVKFTNCGLNDNIFIINK